VTSEEPEHRPEEDPHTFERSLAALEQVVARLESGDVGLEEAVALFEQGRVHLARCRDRLERAQRRIDELTGETAPAPDPLSGPARDD
jgi:exodeoxyribonuclease VII small subunit